MDKKQDQLAELREIRNLMERSSKFLSLSGIAGIIIGIIAIAGVAAAYVYLGIGLSEPVYNQFSEASLYLDIIQCIQFDILSLEQIANIKQNYEKNMKEYAPKVKKLRDEMEKRESDTGLDEYMFSTSKITRAFNRLRAKMYEMNMNEKESNPCRFRCYG